MKSYAKLNLCLHVGAARADGYHPIQSVFQEISLHDDIDIQTTPSSSPTLHLSHDGYSMPNDEDNILHKIFDSLKANCRHDYCVHIHKNIPLGSGMGGASSNAAVFLKELNNIEGFAYSIEELCRMATKFGADIPFFIQGGTKMVTGIGEQLETLDTVPNQYFVIVNPKLHASTKEIYAAFDKQMPSELEERQIQPPYLDKNDLYEAAITVLPELKQISDKLEALTKRHWQMTGSGSTLFSAITKEEGQKIESELRQLFPDMLVQLVYSLPEDKEK